MNKNPDWLSENFECWNSWNYLSCNLFMFYIFLIRIRNFSKIFARIFDFVIEKYNYKDCSNTKIFPRFSHFIILCHFSEIFDYILRFWIGECNLIGGVTQNLFEFYILTFFTYLCSYIMLKPAFPGPIFFFFVFFFNILLNSKLV